MGKEYTQQCDPDDNECFGLLPHFVTDINVCRYVESRFCTSSFLAVYPDYTECTDKKIVQSLIEKC